MPCRINQDLNVFVFFSPSWTCSRFCITCWKSLHVPLGSLSCLFSLFWDGLFLDCSTGDVAGKSGIANDGCGAAGRMTPCYSSEVKGLNESLPCDLLESFGCHAGFSAADTDKEKKVHPTTKPCQRRKVNDIFYPLQPLV